MYGKLTLWKKVISKNGFAFNSIKQYIKYVLQHACYEVYSEQYSSTQMASIQQDPKCMTLKLVQGVAGF